MTSRTQNLGSNEETQPPPHSRRGRSDYLPGGAFKPDDETLTLLQSQVLAWLRVCGARGGTRIEAPDYLALSLPARVCELRKMGHRIDTKRERVGDAHLARYTLQSPVPNAPGDAEAQCTRP